MLPYVTMLGPGVRLSVIRDERFKTGLLSVGLITPLDKKAAAQNAVLPYVLRRGSSRHPDRASLEAELDALCGAAIEPFVKKRGECQVTGFFADFADPDLAGMPDLPERVAELVGELLLSPATQGGRLRKDYVETERENLLADIRAEQNDKRAYADRRLSELMFSKEAYGIPRLGTASQAERIGNVSLTARYKELLRTAAIEIFCVSPIGEERMTRAVRYAFSGLPRVPERRLPFTNVKYEPDRGPRFFEESMPLRQSCLRIGYRLGESMKSPDLAAMYVFDAMFGGSAASRLFLKLREELGLSYYAESGIDCHKGVLTVSCGIDAERLDETMKAISDELDELAAGRFSRVELESARLSVVEDLLSVRDSQSEMENYHLFMRIADARLEPGDLAALASSVSAEDVMRVASGLKMDTCFFLRGEGEHDR